MVRTVEAIRNGDQQAIATEAKFIATTAVEDIATTLRAQTLAARARLSTMIRR